MKAFTPTTRSKVKRLPKRAHYDRETIYGILDAAFICHIGYVLGRQPYVIYGLLRTADAVTPTLAAGTVLASLIVFAAVYATVFGAGIWYLLKLVRKGPQPHEPAPQTGRGEKTPARPLSVGTLMPDAGTGEEVAQ